jgi:hypothetical protein
MVYIKHAKPLTEISNQNQCSNGSAIEIKFLGRLTQVEADLLDMAIDSEKMQQQIKDISLQHKRRSTSDANSQTISLPGKRKADAIAIISKKRRKDALRHKGDISNGRPLTASTTHVLTLGMHLLVKSSSSPSFFF